MLQMIISQPICKHKLQRSLGLPSFQWQNKDWSLLNPLLTLLCSNAFFLVAVRLAELKLIESKFENLSLLLLVAIICTFS